MIVNKLFLLLRNPGQIGTITLSFRPICIYLFLCLYYFLFGLFEVAASVSSVVKQIDRNKICHSFKKLNPYPPSIILVK